MPFYENQWFWTGLFSLLAVFLSLLFVYLREKSNIKIEKIKLYDKDKLEAYKKLYDFISDSFSLSWPSDDPEEEFRNLMKNDYYEKIKPNFPLIDKSIREKLKILESQYMCLREEEFIPPIPMKEFFNKRYWEILTQINDITEKVFDKWDKK